MTYKQTPAILGIALSLLTGIAHADTTSSYTLAGESTAVISSDNGAVTLHSGEVGVIVVQQVGCSAEEEPIIGHTPGELVVQGNANCDLVVFAPSNILMVINAENGAATSDGFFHELLIYSSNSGVTVRGERSHSVSAISGNGDISISNVVGSISADTSNGIVELRNNTGSYRVHSGNGGITGRNLTFTAGSSNIFTSNNGSINISRVRTQVLAKNRKSGLTARGRTSNGTVTISTSFSNKAKSRRSSLSSEVYRGPQKISVKLVSQNGDVRFVR